MLLLYDSGTATNLIDGFIEFMNKEYILYISILEYISDACQEIRNVNRLVLRPSIVHQVNDTVIS